MIGRGKPGVGAAGRLDGLLESWGRQIEAGPQVRNATSKAGRQVPARRSKGGPLHTSTSASLKGHASVCRGNLTAARSKVAGAEADLGRARGRRDDAEAALKKARSREGQLGKAVKKLEGELAGLQGQLLTAPAGLKAELMGKIGEVKDALASAVGKLEAARGATDQAAARLRTEEIEYESAQARLQAAKDAELAAEQRYREAEAMAAAAAARERAQAAQAEAQRVRQKAQADADAWAQNKQLLADLDARAAEAKRRADAATARAEATKESIDSVHAHFSTEGTEIDAVHKSFDRVRYFADQKQNAVAEREARDRAQAAADVAFGQSLVQMIQGLLAEAQGGDSLAITVPSTARVASTLIQGPPITAALELLAQCAEDVNHEGAAKHADDARRSATWALGKGLMPHPRDVATLVADTDTSAAKTFDDLARRLDKIDARQTAIPKLAGIAARDRLTVLAGYRDQLAAFGGERLLDVVAGTAKGSPAETSPLTSTVWSGLDNLASKSYGGVEPGALKDGVRHLIANVPDDVAPLPAPGAGRMSGTDFHDMLDDLFA